jgi:putative peptidoglycan lipid II flippase
MFASVRTLLLGGIVGKALGIGRELISASLFGTGVIATAYRLSQAAFVIPLNGVLSDALTAGFTPTYSRDRVREPRRSRVLFAGMHALLLIASTVLALGLVVFDDHWVRLLAPGLDAQTAKLTAQMVEVMVWAMPLYSLTSLCAAAALAAGKPEMTAARASVQSAGLVLGTLSAWWFESPLLMPLGFVLAYAWLAGWGLKSVFEERLRLWPRAEEWPDSLGALNQVWQAFRLVIWVPIIMQVNFVIERRVASIVDVNAISALDYARFVADTAVILLAMPFGVAGVAEMARMSDRAFKEAATRSFRMLLLIGVPISVGIAVHSDWIIKALYGHGAFGAASIATTSAIMQGSGAFLWAQLIAYAGAKFLSARGLNRAVVGIYAISIGSNIGLNLLLSPIIHVHALGVASGLNNLLAGVSILLYMSLWSSVRRELMWLVGMGLGYVALWLSLTRGTAHVGWLVPAVFVTYWAAAVTSVHCLRRGLADIWEMLRFRRSQTQLAVVPFDGR